MADLLYEVGNQTTNGTNSTVPTCKDISRCQLLIDLYAIPVSIVLIVFLSLFEKRRYTRHAQCMGGLLGCLIPVNLLDGEKDRFAYAAAFGCTTSAIVNRLAGTIIQQNTPSYHVYIFTILSAVGIGIIYYPIFACVAPTHRCVHSLIGLGYTTAWLMIKAMFIKDIIILCQPEDTWLIITTIVMMSLPEQICLLYLSIKFLHMLVHDCIAITRTCRQGRIGFLKSDHSNHTCTCRIKKTGYTRLANSKQLQHVRELLGRTGENTQTGNTWPNIIDVIQLSYKGDRSFKYSPRVTATFTVALLCLYQISIGSFGLGTYMLITLRELLHFYKDKSMGLYEQLDTLLDVSTASYYVSLGLSTLITGIIIFQSFFSFRKNMEMLYKGDFSNIPAEALKQSATTIMTDTLHYSGNQIAYLFWSFIIQHIVFFIVCLLVAYLLILPITGVVPDNFLQPLKAVLITSAIFYVIYFIQYFVSRRWFLQDYYVINNETGKQEKVLSLKNRKAYHNMAYFAFFYYIFIGVVRCLMRIVKAVVLGMVFLGRIDRSGLIRGYETWDTGYMAYVSFLKMELAHCHPVLVVFCDMLSEQTDQRKAKVTLPMYGATSDNGATAIDCDTSSGEHDSLITDEMTRTYNTPSKYNRRVHNRWLKAYTLVNNKKLLLRNYLNDND